MVDTRVEKKRIKEEIRELKEKRKAIILAHNYQIPEVQDIADFLGDSLELSRKASKTDAEVVLFCGVQFMAEIATILCPDKKILLPEKNAGCDMVRMFSLKELKELKEKHPEAETVGYVNSSVEMKAEVDICCTSANAIKVVNSLESEKVIFAPDRYLANYVSRNTDKKIIPESGYCPVHARILPEDIHRKKDLYPEAKVLVHPECIPEVIDLADEVFSTGGICNYSRESDAKEFIIGTEVGILHRLRKENPNKRFFTASEFAICPDMKLITLKKVLSSLKDMQTQVTVSPEIRAKAKKAVDGMMKIG